MRKDVASQPSRALAVPKRVYRQVARKGRFSSGCGAGDREQDLHEIVGAYLSIR